jgi:hypothetical protein
VAQEARHSATLLIEHVVGTLLHIWWRVARIGLIAGAAVALAAEIAGGIITRHFPGGMVHLTALVLGVVAAYAAAVTALVSEIMLGLVQTIRVLEGDVEAGALAAAAIARQEARSATRDVTSLFGLRRHEEAPHTTPRAALAATPGLRAATSAHSMRGPRLNAPTPDVAATEAFAAALPSQLPPLPVRADRLPRIEWADQATSPALSTAPANGSATSVAGASPPRPFDHAVPRLAPLAAGAAVVASAVGELRHRHEDSPVPATPDTAAPPGAASAVTPTAEPNVANNAPPNTAEAISQPAVALETSPITTPVVTTEDAQIKPEGAPLDDHIAAPAASRAELTNNGEDAPLVPPPLMPSRPLGEDTRPAETSAASEPSQEAEPSTNSDLWVAPVSPAMIVPHGMAAQEASQVPDALEGPPTVPRSGFPCPTRPLAPITSPLASPNSDPLTPPTGSGNLWDRLSRALMGISPVQDEPDSGETSESEPHDA